jgi:hypothetical protein
MSQIKNNEITHTGNSGTSNIVLGSAGQVTVQGVLTTTGGLADNSVDGANIALGSDAQGDIMYYNGTDYVRLAKGTAGQALLMNSGATAPEWGEGGGKILQGPVRATDANMGVRFTLTNSANTWTDTGYDVVITPTSATSLIQVTFKIYCTRGSGTEPEYKIQANGVDKDIGNPIYIDVSGTIVPNWVWTYAPGSTSQQTISLWIKAASTGTMHHGYWQSASVPSSPTYGYRNFNDAYAYEIEQ